MININFSSEATSFLKKQIEKKPNALGFKLSVKDYGCSGMSYVYDFAFEDLDKHSSFTTEGLKVFVPDSQIQILNGSTVDLITENLNKTIKISNPNATATCGCGESFSLTKTID